MISRIHEPSMDCEIISTALVLNVATGVISRMHEQSMDCEIIKTNRICMAIRLTAVNSCLPPCLGACPTGKATGEVPSGPKHVALLPWTISKKSKLHAMDESMPTGLHDTNVVAGSDCRSFSVWTAYGSVLCLP